MTHVHIRIVGKKVFTFIKHSFILFKVHFLQGSFISILHKSIP